MFSFSLKRDPFFFVMMRQKISIKFSRIKIFVDLYAITFLIGIKFGSQMFLFPDMKCPENCW